VPVPGKEGGEAVTQNEAALHYILKTLSLGD